MKESTLPTFALSVPHPSVTRLSLRFLVQVGKGNGDSSSKEEDQVRDEEVSLEKDSLKGKQRQMNNKFAN